MSESYKERLAAAQKEAMRPFEGPGHEEVRRQLRTLISDNIGKNDVLCSISRCSGTTTAMRAAARETGAVFAEVLRLGSHSFVAVSSRTQVNDDDPWFPSQRVFVPYDMAAYNMATYGVADPTPLLRRPGE
jgi:hypothetical protein